MIYNIRLWKSVTNNLEEISNYDKKYKNSSIVKVDAMPLNVAEGSLKEFIEDANIADDDIILVEVQKPTKSWCFAPLNIGA